MLDNTTIGILGMLLMLVLIFLRMHIGAVLTLVGALGLMYIRGMDSGLSSLSTIPFSSIAKYSLSVMPLFILMGIVVSQVGIAQEAFETARAWVGQLRGGLAMATVGACGLFAATCGSSLATAVTMGKVALPEMKKLNYDTKLAVGAICCGGSLGILIPPSTQFVLIAILTDLSIGKLFIAGIIPGILEIIFYAITIYILCKHNPKLGPAIAKTTFKRKIISIRHTWAIALLFILVIGGIYGGVFTPTEAGGIGAFGAFLIGLARRRLKWSTVFDSLTETAQTAAMIGILLIGAFVFMKFLTITRIPFTAGEYVKALTIPNYMVIVVVLLMYIITGSFFDVHAVVIVATPILFPMIESLGYDPIWFGVLTVRMIEIGVVTPPFGTNLFGLAGSSGLPLDTLYQSVWPFVIADLLNVALLVAFPILSTFLPNTMI